MHTAGRRELLTALLTLGVGTPSAQAAEAAAKAPEPEPLLDPKVLRVDGDRKLARSGLLLVPKGARPRRLLVLLHGLGETHSEELGLRAWSELYGLVRAHERLMRPPVERILERQRYLTDEHKAELNRELENRPYRGMAYLCPITPNPYRAARDPLFEGYADWLLETLLPAAKRHLGTPLCVGLDGCSMGGYVALELFLRRPKRFGSFGMVQSAFGQGSVPAFARRLDAALENHGASRVHLQTSTADPYRAVNTALAKQLRELGRDPELTVLPGPHDQPWLREVGTLTMLMFHDRQLPEPER